MHASESSGWSRHFRGYHYIMFVAALGLSFLASYLLFSSNKAIAPAPVSSSSKTNSTAKQVPTLSQSVVISGLSHPWDVRFLPDKTMLVTERSGALSVLRDGKKIELFTPDDVVARGEGGMLGLAIDPEFSQNHYIYTCFNSDKSGSLDVRVVRWELYTEGTGSVKRSKDIVTGIPANPSGRHSGCRVGFGPDRNLWIGTGDAANEDSPQNLKSLGGKILRVDRDGKGVVGNLGGEADSRIYSYGHRNIQGLAFYDSIKKGSYGVSVEHGSDRDDEVNPLVKGNFGWAPTAGYNESVPMTDAERFPSAIKSVWSSGNPTIATSGAAFLKGSAWGLWEGRLAVGVLKGQHLLLLEMKDDGTVGEQRKLLDGEFGRLRAMSMGPDGELYITTDNGSDDKIVKIVASAQ